MLDAHHMSHKPFTSLRRHCATTRSCEFLRASSFKRTEALTTTALADGVGMRADNGLDAGMSVADRIPARAPPRISMSILEINRQGLRSELNLLILLFGYPQ